MILSFWRKCCRRRKDFPLLLYFIIPTFPSVCLSFHSSQVCLHHTYTQHLNFFKYFIQKVNSPSALLLPAKSVFFQDNDNRIEPCHVPFLVLFSEYSLFMTGRLTSKTFYFMETFTEKTSNDDLFSGRKTKRIKNY